MREIKLKFYRTMTTVALSRRVRHGYFQSETEGKLSEMRFLRAVKG